MTTTVTQPVPVSEIHSVKPKTPRLLHAFPDDSNVALCGARHTGGPVLTSGKPCPRCRDEAQRRFWGAR